MIQIRKLTRKNRFLIYTFIIIALIPVALFIAFNPFNAKAASTQASESASTTTTSTTYEQMNSMTITPGSGDYMVHFSTSIKKSTGSSDQYISLFVGGVQVTHTERHIGSDSSYDGGDISSNPIAIDAYVSGVGASDAIEIQWKTSAGTATAYERTLIVESVTATDITQVTATANDTSFYTYDTQLNSMTLTPGSGDYLVFFGSSMENTAATDTYFTIYVNGSPVAYTERQFYTESSFTNTAYPVMTHAYIPSVGASDAIEIQWRVNAGTATAEERTLVVQKVDSANITQATATASTNSTSTSDTAIDSMSLSPGVGDYLIFFSTSINSTNNGGSNQYTSIYAPTKITHSEREIYTEGSFDSGNILTLPTSSAAYVTDLSAIDTITAKWHTTAGTITAYERTITAYKVGAGSSTPHSGDIVWKMDEGYGQYLNNSLDSGTITAARGTNSSPDSTDPSWIAEDLCVSGKCLQFDSSSSQQITSSLAVSSVKSISFWVRPTSTTTSLAVLNGATGNASITASSGIISAGAGFSSPTIYVNGVENDNMKANAWQHITVTTASGISASNIILGRVNTGYLNGFIDEIKIFDNQLTADEVKAEYSSVGTTSQVSAVFGPDYGRTLSDGLVSYWRMDDNLSGNGQTITDYSGNGNDGTTEYGANTTGMDCTATGKFGRSCHMDGVDDNIGYSSTGLSASSGTISTWVNHDDSGSAEYIFSHYNSGNRIYMYLDANSYYIKLGADTTIDTTADVTAGEWHHLALTWENGTYNAYMDGKIYKSGSYSSLSSIGSCMATGAFDDCFSTPDQTFDGMIDDFRVYNKALSEGEINQVFNYAPGPVAHWEMNEGAGSNIYDTSSNNISSTTYGSPTWVKGVHGDAISLDGTNDYFVAEDNDVLSFTNNVFSFSAWVKRDGNPSNTEYILRKDGPTEYEFGIYIYSAGDFNVVLRESDGTAIVSEGTTTNISDGKWHHLAATSDGSVLQLYIDGVAEDYDPVFSGNFMSNTTAPLNIGNDDGGGNEFQGEIDDIRIYNYVQTPDQIIKDMNAGHPAPGSPIGSALLHLKFDEGYGDTAYDSSPQANNGDLEASGTCPGDTNCPTWTPNGKIGGALSFDANDNGVFLGASSIYDVTGDLTISTWVNSSDTGDAHYIIHKGETGDETEAGNDLFFLRTDNTSGYDIEYGHEYSTGLDEYHVFDTNLSLSTWYHLVLVRDASTKTVSLYVNSQLNETYTYTNNPTGGSGGEMAIGCDDDYSSGYEFTGIIDDFRLYTSAFTKDQVNILYNQGYGAVMGAISTDSSGNPDYSTARSYCLPGDTSSSCAPIMHWKFDENTGTTTVSDSTGGYSGTMNGSMLEGVWEPGKYGSAIHFDGSNDYIAVTDDGNLTPSQYMSISMWVKLDQLSSQTFINKYCTTCSGGTSYKIEANSGGRVYFDIEVTGETDYSYARTADGAITAGEWYYLTGIYDSSGLRIYVNGVDLTAYVYKPPSSALEATTSELRLGAVNSSSGRTDGVIDDIKVYNYSLSPAQMAWDYTQGKPLAQFRLDECTGSTLNNAAGDSALNGTITVGAGGTNTSTGTCSSGSGNEMWDNGTTGKQSSSLHFDGVDDYATFSGENGTFSTNSFSATTWINRTSDDGGVEYIMSNEDANSDGWFMFLNSDDTIRCSYNGQNVDSTTTINTSSWYHLACISSGSNLYLYVNGKLEDSLAISGSIAETTDFRIGARSFSITGYFSGKMDDVRVYNYPLTLQQLRSTINFGAVGYQ